MSFEERIFIDIEVPISPDLAGREAKHAIEHAIKRKLEEIPTEIYEQLRDECNIIVFRSVRPKGGP